MVQSAHPELKDVDLRLQELEDQGYTIFPDYLDRDTTTAVRAHIDSLAGPIGPNDQGRTKHVLRHPIPGEIMARLASHPATLELSALLIGSRDLRLREQVLVRSDPDTPPYQPPAWHIDGDFCRREFEAAPRQVYYQMLHYCSTVSSGGAAFMIVPRSHKLSLDVEEEADREKGERPIPDLTALVSGVKEGDGVEICASEGDVIVFNPLCRHAASANRTDRPRYVYFSSFFHPSAHRLMDLMRRHEYRDNFPDSLRRGLPSHLRNMLD